MKTKFVKRLMAMALVACMGCAVVGCSDKDGSSDNSGKKDERTTYEVLKELDINDYITLGEYKGLKLEKEITIVTDKEVETEIKGQLEANPAVVKDRTDVRKGDTVNIDYVGRMDGKEFAGGKAEDQPLTIGSGMFIEGFEDGLIGAVVGETRVLELSFPDPYPNNPDFAGKPVEFEVTVNSISAPLEAPTDEWVKEYYKGCDSAADFPTFIKNSLQEAYDKAADDQLAYDAWTQVVEDTKVHKYPDVLVERGKDLYKEEIKTYATYYGMDVEEYLEFSGVTEDDYEGFAEEYGESIAAQGMINYAICQAEGFEIDGEAFKAELKLLAEEYELTEEELYKKYKQDDIEQTVLLNMVCDVLVESADITEVESSKSAE